MAEPPDFAMRSSEAATRAAEPKEPLPKANDVATRSGRVFSPAESALLVKEKGRIVTLE
jgi:hypothetical protein